MALLLGLDTATATCSVALAEDRRVLAEASVHRPRAHAETLVTLIRDVLRAGGASRSDLDAVAVSAGPGSYTGLRIGVSTAKGLAMAVGAALVAVPSLEAMAWAAQPAMRSGDAVCALFPSRRAEVYAAVYRRTDAGLDALAPAAALPAAALAERLLTLDADTLWLAGPGLDRLRPLLTDLPYLVRALPADLVPPSAARVARLGTRRLEAGATEDLAAFEPQYLKAAQATRPQQTAFEKLSF